MVLNVKKFYHLYLSSPLLSDLFLYVSFHDAHQSMCVMKLVTLRCFGFSGWARIQKSLDTDTKNEAALKLQRPSADTLLHEANLHCGLLRHTAWKGVDSPSPPPSQPIPHPLPQTGKWRTRTLLHDRWRENACCDIAFHKLRNVITVIEETPPQASEVDKSVYSNRLPVAKFLTTFHVRLVSKNRIVLCSFLKGKLLIK